jgi:hypothetical protein
LLAGPDPLAPALGSAAAVALFRCRAGEIPVILGCGLAGLLGYGLS